MRNLFCAKCQAVTAHEGERDLNGEFVFHCKNVVNEVPCDRFIKLPADTTPEQFDVYAAAHQASNEGQVSMEEQDKKLEAILAAAPAQEVPKVDEAPVE